MPRLFLFLLCLLLWMPAARAAYPESAAVTSEQSKAWLIGEGGHITPGKPYMAALVIEMNPGWHTYWINPGDTGLPTLIHWDLPEGYKAGPIHWPTPERILTGTIVSLGYHGRVVLPVPISPSEEAKGTAHLSAKAEWLACADICIRETGAFELDLPVADTPQEPFNPLIKEGLDNVPQLYKTPLEWQVQDDAYQIIVPPELTDNRMDFFPLGDSVMGNGKPRFTPAREGNTLITVAKGYTPAGDTLEGVLVSGQKAYLISALPAPAAVTGDSPNLTPDAAQASPAIPPDAKPSAPSLGLFSALLFALLGGLILNAMPCVLPVLALKLMALTKKAASSRREAALHGVLYALGVVASFVALGGLLVALQHGGKAIGWGFQLQSPSFVMFLAAVFTLAALNFSGVFSIPMLFGRLAAPSAQDSRSGSFLTGTLAVLVATPCTVPFMAPAVGYGLGSSPLHAMLVFLFLGLGMALPFLLVALWPRALALLPRPGAWMETMRQLFAFPLYGAAMWLLWLLASQNGLLSLAFGMAALLFLAMAAWVAGRRLGRMRIVLLFFASLWMMYSATAPRHASAPAIEPFSPARLEELRREGKPVFVNATAAWCLTCKFNEMNTLGRSNAKALFERRGVAYLLADWTRQDGEITRYLQSFGRQGVPMYVFYPPQGEPVLLPQFLTYEALEQTLER